MLSKKLALRYRSVLRLKGPDSLTLLQGLVTPNILTRSSAYGYALDVRGRILFDFFFHTLHGSDERSNNKEISYALDLDSDSTAQIALKHLKQHRLRKKVELHLEESALSVFVSSKPEPLLSTVDPRTENTNIPLFRGLLKNENAELSEFDAHEYNEFRLEHGWAEGRKEIPSGASFPLEYNGDILPGETISFNKGCYVGQELTARTHHTGVVRKRMMPLMFEGRVSGLNLDSPIVNSKGKTVGKLRSEIYPSGRALGLLRVKDVMESPELECNGLVCRATIPTWWPELD